MLGDKMLTMRSIVLQDVDLSTTGVKLVVPPLGTVPMRLQEAPAYVVVGMGIIATAAISNAVIAVQEIKSDGSASTLESITVNVSAANVGKPIVVTPTKPLQCDKGSGFRLNVTSGGGSGAAAHIAVHYVTSEEDLPLQRLTVEVQNV